MSRVEWPHDTMGSSVSVQTEGFPANHVNVQSTHLFILLCRRQIRSFIVRLWRILVAVILLLASLRCVPSVGPAPLLAGVRLKGEGCCGARDPAVMGFIFPYSAILRI